MTQLDLAKKRVGNPKATYFYLDEYVPRYLCMILDACQLNVGDKIKVADPHIETGGGVKTGRDVDTGWYKIVTIEHEIYMLLDLDIQPNASYYNRTVFLAPYRSDTN